MKDIDGNAVLDQFSNVKIKYKDMKKDKGTSYPKEIELSATSEKGTLSGTIKFIKKFSHFNLKDELNFFERSFAKSNPSVINFRYSADYELVYKTEAGEKVLSGKALGGSECQFISREIDSESSCITSAVPIFSLSKPTQRVSPTFVVKVS